LKQYYSKSYYTRQKLYGESKDLKDYYGDYLLTGKIWKFLEKERSAQDIVKKTKVSIATVYRILQSLDKHNIVTVRFTKIKWRNRPLKLYKIKTKRSQS